MTDEHNIIDNEGEVDQKIKNRILKSRDRVDEAEREIFVKAATDPQVRLSDAESAATWGVVVKQYLRNVEPILRADEIDDSEYFYKHIELGEVKLVPGETDGRDYSIVDHDDLSKKEMREVLRLPFDATIPDPETKTINGLRTVIEMPPVVTEEWRVKVSSGIHADYETVTAIKSIPKQVYTDAVRRTDEFLQGAGVGIDISPEQVPDYGFEEVGIDE